MSALNLCYHFKTYNFYRYSQFLSNCLTHKRNYATSILSSKENEFKKNTAKSTVLENYDHDTFGDLRLPLEKTFGKHSKSFKVIKIKSRPTSKKTNVANTFGNLSDKNCLWYPDVLDEPKIDNDQSDDSVIVKNISRKYRNAKVYLERMKLFVKEKKLKEALDLFIEMKRNHVAPTHPHFTFMIGACGKTGYTEMAFMLLRQMTDRNMKPSSATITGLFNSCAESPFLDYGLKKAKFLREKIKSKNWRLNEISYHAMIKAFGKCGDIQTAFEIVDEMATNKIKIDVETYSFLLMSCASDKESGFTHAIEVWRKMKRDNCLPNEFSYNLLLRTVRDCDIGPEEISTLLLQHWTNYLKRPYGFKVKEFKTESPILQITTAESVTDENCDKKEECSIENKEKAMENVKTEILKDNNEKVSEIHLNSNKSNSYLIEKIVSNDKMVIENATPSVLGERPKNQPNIIDVNLIKTSSDRLTLIGGPEGILNDMKINSITPSIKTFTLLLECLPPYFEAEEKLISLIEALRIVPDIGFCNVLMKRRIFRHENLAAKEVLLKMSRWSLTPDIVTFGILALGCRHFTYALSFLRDLKNLGVHPNIEIVGALVGNACTACDFKYLHHVLKLMEIKNIQPNEKVLKKINNCVNTTRKNIINMEHKKDVHKVFKQPNFSKDFKEFCSFYDLWLQKMKLEKEENVWTQYKTEICDKYVEESY